MHLHTTEASVVKFCYIDESEGMNGQVVVSAGIVVDGARMHATKSDWTSLLTTVSGRLPAPLREFKASDLYRGAGRWSRMSGIDRAYVMDDIIAWIAERKHAVVYSGALKSAYDECTRPEVVDLPDTWCAANQHVLLALQRSHQQLRSPKGHTVTIFDIGGHNEHLVHFVRTPPSWTDAYYGRTRNAPRLGQLVDVPYFVDSEHAMLVQTADFVAYVLRRYVELVDLASGERYAGESAKVESWARAIAERAPIRHLWPQRQRTTAHDIFRDLAPPSLAALRP